MNSDNTNEKGNKPVTADQDNAQQLIGDREQTLQQLRTMAGMRSPDTSLTAFLTFCFRASDPDIYQQAAYCLGYWLPAVPALFDWFEEYCAARNQPLSAPVELNGQRSTRRMLLARCAAAISAHPLHPDLQGRWPGVERLIPAFAEDAALPASDADTAILLHALLVLREDPALQGRLDHAISQFLEQAEQRPTLLGNLAVLRHWTRLILDLAGSGHSGYAPLQGRIKDLLGRAGRGNVRERLQALNGIDVILQTVVATVGPPTTSVLGSYMGDGGLWIQLRLFWWCHRMTGSLPMLPDARPASVTLQIYYQATQAADTARQGNILGSDMAGGTEQRILAHATPGLRGKRRWLSSPAGERALQLFLVMDLMGRDAPLPVDPTDLGVSLPGSDRDAVLLAVLSRVATWEQLPAAALVDPRRLHALREPVLGLALLPASDGSEAPQSDGLEALADVVEQQLRLALAHDPAFDAKTYLLLSLVRQPPQRLYRQLVELSRQRQYTDLQGNQLPITEWAQELQQLTAHPEKAGAGWRLLEPPPQPQPDPRDDLLALLEWLGADPHVRPRPQSAMARMEHLQPTHRPPLAVEGHEAQHASLGELQTAIHAIAHRIIDLAQQLRPAAETDLESGRELARQLHAAVDELRREFAAHLPAPDARSVDQALGQRLNTMQRWATTLDACQRLQTGHRAAEDVLVELTRHGDLPDTLVPLLIRALSPDRGQPDDDPAALLDWALEQRHRLPERVHQPWVRGLVEHWRRLLEAAMERQDVQLVPRLVGEMRFRPLQQHPDAAETLRNVRDWCYARLMLGTARLAARHGGNRNPLRCVGGFLLHFSAVWIGLLVGAILMLDFGDPWKAMAEEGDVAGIAMTGLLGLGGTLLYLMVAQRRRVSPAANQGSAGLWARLTGRSLAFLSVCLAFTLAVTSGLWLLLSGTDEVVHGPMAIGHIVVWAGFALFAGTFFGLVAKDT